MKSFNNLGIGVDLELISRFKNLHRKKNNKFLNKIFTKREMDYCFSKKTVARHLAARFTAKEAIIKALSSLSEKAPAFNEIEIFNNANGVPTATLKKYNIKISLSHCRDKAMALALVKKVKQ